MLHIINYLSEISFKKLFLKQILMNYFDLMNKIKFHKNCKKKITDTLLSNTFINFAFIVRTIRSA